VIARIRCVLAALVLGIAPAACAHAANARASELVVAETSDFASLDPLYLQGHQGIAIASLLYSRLLGFDADGNLAPELATAVPSLANGGISRDGRTLTYRLRPAAHWSDGVPLTARDVLFTHRAVMDPKSAAPETEGDDEIAAFDVLDAHTFRVTLKRPWAPFVALFTRPILPEHILAKSPDLQKDPFNAAPVGSGPYTVVEWKRGDHLTLAADPHAWNGAPHIARIRIDVVPDYNTTELRLRTGDVDLSTGLDRSTEATIDLSRNRIVSIRGRSFTLLICNHDAPLLDLAVRRALAIGLDRARIVRKASAGRNDAATPFRGLLGSDYDAQDPPPPFDPARARALLDADGWRVGPDGIRVRAGHTLRLGIATLSGYPEFVSAIGQMQQDAKALGIALEVKAYDENVAMQLFRRTLPGATFDTFFASLQTDYDPDPSWLVGCKGGKPNPYNIAHACDPVLDALLAKGVATFDPAVRKQTYAAVQRRLQDTLPFIMFAQTTSSLVVSRRVHHVDPIPVGGTFWNVTDWTLDS
jgi:peptide/nickel transport system substrate-binding protein